MAKKNLSIGIDVVTVSRFKYFIEKPEKSLLRVFSQEEIMYCRSNKKLSAERFAARFAAKEALFKALAAHFRKRVPFLYICKISSLKTDPSPSFIIDQKHLPIESFQTLVSLSHTRECAVAAVIVQKI